MVFHHAQRGCREHHRGMTQRKRKATAREEWDFRDVKKEHLHIAVEYEYLRELITRAQATEARALLKEFENNCAKHHVNDYL